tara:strand:+ start:1477 stop:1941 length:465 start_codon:yes stop_codon:yes gene_type:complete
MKKNTKLSLAVTAIVLLVALVAYLMTSTPREKIVEVPKPYAVEVPVEVRREPEFRKPPVKEYKPGHVQQMGVLLGEDGETLPLYGKEVRGRRDMYHYYTSTPGQQIYSLPVSHENRDCMDDMGCRELYGQERVNVLGKSAPYEAKLYRTDNFFV